MERDGPSDARALTSTTPPVELEARQLELFQELTRRQRQSGGQSRNLAAMFRGAILSLSQEDNPDRLPLAAHGLRELIEKLPRVLGAAATEKPNPLDARVREFRGIFVAGLDRTKCFRDENWAGELDPPLIDILNAAKTLVDEFRVDHPERPLRAARTLRTLARGADPLPGTYEERMAKQLIDLEKYFIGVSHHDFETTPIELQRRLNSLTDLLLDYMRPQSIEAMRSLDELISEAEHASDA